MKRILNLAAILVCGTLFSQDYTFPDSAIIAKNKVKSLRIYFNSPDGKKYQQKELRYNHKGQLIRECGDGNGFYNEYVYDSFGRKIIDTRRGSNGSFVSRVTYEYGIEGMRTVRYYSFPDSTVLANLYVYDRNNRKIREETYDRDGLRWEYTITYDSAGNVIASTDSNTVTKTKNWRSYNKLTRQRTYDPKGNFLHEYNYTYDYFGRIWKLTDSTGTGKSVTYTVVYSKDGGPREGIQRNGSMMSQQEQDAFEKAHPEFRVPEYLEEDYGLPVPETVNEHKLTRDEKGNIVQDELTQRQGSYSQSYVYVYEYEFY